MSQRLLREMNRSTTQQLTALSGNVHYLKGNIGAGAVRSAGPVTSTAPGSIPTTLLSLDLSLGRWVAMFRCQLAAENVAGDQYAMQVQATGAEDAILPIAGIRTPASGTLWLPIADIAEFRNDEPLTVELQAWHTNGGTVTWQDAVLFCLPV